MTFARSSLLSVGLGSFCLLIAACSSATTYPGLDGRHDRDGVPARGRGGAVLTPEGGTDATAEDAAAPEAGLDTSTDAPGDGDSDGDAIAVSLDGALSDAQSDASMRDAAIAADTGDLDGRRRDRSFGWRAAEPGVQLTTWSAPIAVDGLAFTSQPIVTLTADELTVAWVLSAQATARASYSWRTVPTRRLRSGLPSSFPPREPRGRAEARPTEA